MLNDRLRNILEDKLTFDRESKLSVFKENNLIGCLNDSGVTSTNYKDYLCKEERKKALDELMKKFQELNLGY
jgi:hypothetical protein